jgi:hypothetical protein
MLCPFKISYLLRKAKKHYAHFQPEINNFYYFITCLVQVQCLMGKDFLYDPGISTLAILERLACLIEAADSLVAFGEISEI